MLKKKLGLEAIERSWFGFRCSCSYFKIPSTLIIPEGCKEIGYCAFKCCDWLEKVVIPESIEEIGDWGFWGCKEATIILRKHKIEFKHLNITAFDGCKYVKEEIRS